VEYNGGKPISKQHNDSPIFLQIRLRLVGLLDSIMTTESEVFEELLTLM